MKKINCFIIPFAVICIVNNLYALKPYSEQASNFSATISVTVNPGTNFTEYKYEILYSQSNPRDLALLEFYFPPQVVESEFLKADGVSDSGIKWRGGFIDFPDIKSILFEPMGGKLTNIWINEHLHLQKNSTDLKPGQELTLSLITKGIITIPGINKLDGFCTFAGWVFNVEVEGYPDKTYDNGFHPKSFQVVGPVLKPADNTGMIDKLIELTAGAYSLKWISKLDVYQGLMDKLNAAKQQILLGQSKYHTAWNILEAYKHLLNAQRWKAITEPCFQMLYFNADLLISKLK